MSADSAQIKTGTREKHLRLPQAQHCCPAAAGTALHPPMAHPENHAGDHGRLPTVSLQAAFFHCPRAAPLSHGGGVPWRKAAASSSVPRQLEIYRTKQSTCPSGPCRAYSPHIAVSITVSTELPASPAKGPFLERSPTLPVPWTAPAPQNEVPLQRSRLLVAHTQSHLASHDGTLKNCI